MPASMPADSWSRRSRTTSARHPPSSPATPIEDLCQGPEAMNLLQMRMASSGLLADVHRRAGVRRDQLLRGRALHARPDGQRPAGLPGLRSRCRLAGDGGQPDADDALVRLDAAWPSATAARLTPPCPARRTPASPWTAGCRCHGGGPADPSDALHRHHRVARAVPDLPGRERGRARGSTAGSSSRASAPPSESDLPPDQRTPIGYGLRDQLRRPPARHLPRRHRGSPVRHGGRDRLRAADRAGRSAARSTATSTSTWPAAAPGSRSRSRHGGPRRARGHRRDRRAGHGGRRHRPPARSRRRRERQRRSRRPSSRWPRPASGCACGIEREKGRAAWGELTAIERPGPDRVPPPCPLFGSCGGCQWQHVTLEAQRAAKKAMVERALGIAIPPVRAAGPDFRLPRSRQAHGGQGGHARVSRAPLATTSSISASRRAARCSGPSWRARCRRCARWRAGWRRAIELEVQAGAEGVHLNVVRADALGAAHARREIEPPERGGHRRAVARRQADARARGGRRRRAREPAAGDPGRRLRPGRPRRQRCAGRGGLEAVGPEPGIVLELYAGSGTFTRHLAARRRGGDGGVRLRRRSGGGRARPAQRPGGDLVGAPARRRRPTPSSSIRRARGPTAPTSTPPSRARRRDRLRLVRSADAGARRPPSEGRRFRLARRRRPGPHAADLPRRGRRDLRAGPRVDDAVSDGVDDRVGEP